MQHSRRMQRMGSKEIILFLMVCLHFYYPASCLPLGKNLTSARLQDNAGEKETGEYDTSTRDGKIIAHRSNFASGAAGGRGGSSSRGGGGSGEEGNGGHSTPKTTAGIIPLYAAGAGHHNNHHGAASCNRIPTLWAVFLASLVVHIYVVLGSENLI
ncbi:hypothetical protein RHMOL_Rhmol03G0109600 [Rhododendron molle]|uniref:Uncharacterized protein n=3 Tax=Rhododendron molle TaxID=49168 RepID=A0ACC0PD53_RHOML|nr:hypothetical protein RHMOL_Rhmol03G0109600 [Rhododendron molle]KAI8563411.1 hypothetical protein RHMOL_Rhmol03G0109600 [Rhododendron molle]